jgi:hypothetical protein
VLPTVPQNQTRMVAVDLPFARPRPEHGMRWQCQPVAVF